MAISELADGPLFAWAMDNTRRNGGRGPSASMDRSDAGMSGRDPRYDVLFEPARLGPVTVKNRFNQAPRCNGLSAALPRGHAALRGV